MNNFVLVVVVTENTTQSGCVFPVGCGDLITLRKKLTSGQLKRAVLLWISSKYLMVTWRSYEDCFSSKHIRWEWPLASIEVKFESCAQAETNLRGDWRKYWEHHQLHSIIWGLAHDKGVTCSQTRDHIVYNCKPLQYNELPINQLRHHGSVSRCVMLCSWSRLREFIRSFTTTQLMTNNLTEELPRDMLGAKI